MPVFVFKHFWPCQTFRLSYQNFLQTAQQSFLRGGGMLCPKLGGVAGPFSLAGLLNWGGAKTGNWRVDKNRDDQGTNGLMGIWKLKRD